MRIVYTSMQALRGGARRRQAQQWYVAQMYQRIASALALQMPVLEMAGLAAAHRVAERRIYLGEADRSRISALKP